MKIKLPKTISDADFIYIRATPIPRALESVQQAFTGLYPRTYRATDFLTPTIIVRSPADETLFPNDASCRRFAQISRAFAARAAERWNNTSDMDYVSKKIGKWMPSDKKLVGVDSRPRLSGIMDTINATDAHPGKATKLPKEFYDATVRSSIDKICVEEWFQGYVESREYRTLGIGGLMGDIVGRMVSGRETGDPLGVLETGGVGAKVGLGRGGDKRITFGLSGCHDTTLAAALASLGAFEGESWPPFTSHIAFELFKGASRGPDTDVAETPASGSWFSWLTGESPATTISKPREALSVYTHDQKQKLENHFVRVRYNDKVMKVPGCKQVGKHLDGDDSFCTLVSPPPFPPTGILWTLINK
jgi:acid phosphatase